MPPYNLDHGSIYDYLEQLAALIGPINWEPNADTEPEDKFIC